MNKATNDAVESHRQAELAAQQLASLENVPPEKGTLEERIANAKNPDELQAVMAQAELEAAQEAINARVKATLEAAEVTTEVWVRPWASTHMTRSENVSKGLLFRP